MERETGLEPATACFGRHLVAGRAFSAILPANSVRQVVAGFAWSPLPALELGNGPDAPPPGPWRPSHAQPVERRGVVVQDLLFGVRCQVRRLPRDHVLTERPGA